MSRVVLRPDTGAASGLGHVQRCLALAAALEEAGAECSFAVPDAEAVRSRVEAAGFAVAQLADPSDAAELAAAGPVVVVDSYLAGDGYLPALVAAGATVVAIDDHAAAPIHARLCVNGGIAAASLPYRSATGDTEFLLGPEYAMQRPELWDVVPRERGGEVDEVLVTLGGSDPHRLAPDLLRCLDEVETDFGVTLVVGPYFEERERLAELAGSSRRRVELLGAPAGFVDQMQRADLAISAAGQTLYELVRLGVPTVALEVASNQRPALDALRAAGAVRRAESSPAAVAAAVAELVGDSAARAALSAAAGALLDGQGARRVAAAVAALS